VIGRLYTIDPPIPCNLGVSNMKLRGLSLLVPIVLMAGMAARAATPGPVASVALPVKVMVVSMFRPEGAPWLKALKISREIPVPGLSAGDPLVRCSADGVCQMTTGMGHANATASIMAVAYSGLFDLRKTYFLIAGVAGIDPDRGTIGSATWARFAVDAGIAHEIDVRDLPKGWSDGYYGILTNSADQKPRFDYHTEVFRLNEALLQKALALSKGVELADSDDVRAYRAHFPGAPANQPPQVVQCDTASGDTWWTGPHLEEHARHWVKLLTDNQGVYCTTQQEDNATMVALTRASQSGLLDLQRVAILRTASDFDRPYPGQDTVSGLHAQLSLEGASSISTDNLVKAGMPLVQAIVSNWPQWQAGVPIN
jgi:purine nucleoside permease